MAAFDKVRVLVIGDSGVGKTSLVHLICQNTPIGNPDWTIGCSVEVKLHDYKAGTPAEKTYFVEMWDVGGFSAHQNCRSLYYNPCHGIILVHDLTNRKSQQNLRKWLAEVLNKDSKDVRDDYDFDPEQFAGSSSIPILVIGTKLDLAQSVREQTPQRASSIADECGADEINLESDMFNPRESRADQVLDCSHVKHLTPGSSNSVKLSRFFDKVIQRKYHTRESNSTVQSRRPGVYTKSLHSD